MRRKSAKDSNHAWLERHELHEFSRMRRPDFNCRWTRIDADGKPWVRAGARMEDRGLRMANRERKSGDE
ncbi:MAG: hypothetical protein JWQ71_3539 [Pedosphaera sp.]|nr:hypothetical protein [Pedosphaera sp.]